MTRTPDWRDAAERVLAERRGGGGLFEPCVAWGADGTVVGYVPSGTDAEVEGRGGAGISAEAALALEGAPHDRLVRCAGAAVRAALREIAVGSEVEISVGDGEELVAACALVLLRRERSDLRVAVVGVGGVSSGSVAFRRCLQNCGVPGMHFTAENAEDAESVVMHASAFSASSAVKKIMAGSLLCALALTSAELYSLAAHFTRHGGLIPESLSRPPLPA